MSTQHFDSLDREKQLYNEEVEELGTEMFRRLAGMGIKSWSDRQKIAALIVATYDDYKESNELADYLRLENYHIWCYENTTKSLEKYNKYLEQKQEQYYT